MAIEFNRPGGTASAGEGGGGGTAFEPLWKQIHDGDITDAETVEFRGYNVSIGTTEEGFSMNNARENYLTSAEQLQIVSFNANDTSAGTGARTVLVSGLDANWAPISEAISMNGTTDVTTVNSYLRVNEIRVTSAGSAGSNQSLILAENNASSTRIHVIYTNHNLSGAGTYSVAAGKTFYLTHLTVTTDTADNTGLDLKIRAHDFENNNGVDEMRWRGRMMDASSSGLLQLDFSDNPLVFTEKTDIEITGAALASGVGGSMLAQGYLVDDPA